MNGRRLILKDGTTIENGEAGYADGKLWVWLPDFTMQSAAAIAFDATKMDKIIFQYGEMSDEYDNFTNCISIMLSDERVAVCMTRGE